MLVWVAIALAAPGALAILWLRWRSATANERAVAAARARDDGDFDTAVALFESLGHQIELARLYALRGDVTRATRTAEAAQREAGRMRGVARKASAAQLLLIEVLIACRSGALEAARALLLREWRQFETAEGAGGWRAEACLVRGFLDAAAGDSVEVWLGLDDATRARVRWMGAEWPALRAFIDAHDP